MVVDILLPHSLLAFMATDSEIKCTVTLNKMMHFSGFEQSEECKSSSETVQRGNVTYHNFKPDVSHESHNFNLLLTAAKHCGLTVDAEPNVLNFSPQTKTECVIDPL